MLTPLIMAAGGCLLGLAVGYGLGYNSGADEVAWRLGWKWEDGTLKPAKGEAGV